MPARLVINQDVSPWTALYQANRFAARSADGTWFYGVQDGTNGRILHASYQGLKEITLSPQPTMRPTLYADPSGLYAIAGFDGDKTHLLIWYIEEYQSVYPSGHDPRVDALVSQLADLSQSVTQIETALGNLTSAPGGALSEADTEALRRLKVWMGIA
jgi:hypothetical protein